MLRFHILRKNQIQNNGDDKDNRNTVLCKDGLNHLRKNRKQICALGKAEADAERERRNHSVALRKAALAYHLQAADDNGAEHHNGAAAEHCIRQRCEQCAEHREHAGKNHNHCAGCNGEAIDNLGHRNQTDVLAERCNRQATKDRGQRADKAVTGDGTGGFLFRDIASQTGGSQRRGITDGFGCRYQEDEHDRHNRIRTEFHAERHQLRNGDKRCACQ